MRTYDIVLDVETFRPYSNLMTPRYFVKAIDDTGCTYFGRLFRSATIAARSLARVEDGIDAEEFARTWNAVNASGSCRYEIGLEE